VLHNWEDWGRCLCEEALALLQGFGHRLGGDVDFRQVCRDLIRRLVWLLQKFAVADHD
jgi:hypothetical protein